MRRFILAAGVAGPAARPLSNFTPSSDLWIYFAGDGLWMKYVGPHPIAVH